MQGTHALMARLLYGTGMRLMECTLRVKDVDFERRELTVRDGKGERTDGRCCRCRWWLICRRIWGGCGLCGRQIRQPGDQGCRCRKRWCANIRRRLPVGWFWVFLRAACRSTRVAVSSAGTTHMSRALQRAIKQGLPGRDCQASVDAYFAAFLRHAFAGIGLRHSDCARTARAFGCVDDDDLYPCLESWWSWCGVAAG